jgi:hypothetical protein
MKTYSEGVVGRSAPTLVGYITGATILLSLVAFRICAAADENHVAVYDAAPTSAYSQIGELALKLCSLYLGDDSYKLKAICGAGKCSVTGRVLIGRKVTADIILTPTYDLLFSQADIHNDARKEGITKLKKVRGNVTVDPEILS